MRIVVDPGLELYHFESLSKAGTYNWELQRLAERWGPFTDPYVNPVFDQWSPFFERDLPEPERMPKDFSAAFQRWLASRRPRGVDESVRFSFILSVYNTPARLLRELEETILNQFYQNFEWIIVGNGSTLEETLEWEKSISQKSPKISYFSHKKNQGIMGGYGSAFARATGDYVVPVDADDFLMLDALDILASAIHANDHPAILYSDECKSDVRSTIFAPFHKPDWDPVLFTNMCYPCHITAVRRDVAVAVGAYQDMKATWCHDWDTFWRVSRAGYAPVHVPEVLYAWRINPGSTASIESSGKPEALDSQTHVLNQHLRLTGSDRCFELVENPLYGHKGMWRLMPRRVNMPKVTVIIDGRGEAIETVAKRLLALHYPGAVDALVLLEGAAGQPSKQSLSLLSLARPGDGISTAFNITLVVGSTPLAVLRQSVATAELVAYCGSGITIDGMDGLVEMAGLLRGYEDAVAIGGRVIGPDETLSWAGGFFGFGGFIDSPDFGRRLGDSGYFGLAYTQRSVDAVNAAHWLARSRFLAKVLARIGDAATMAQLASAMAVCAYAEGQRILYTPFSVVRAPGNVRPALLDETHLATLGGAVPTSSRYYNPRLSQRSGAAYRPDYL